MRLNSTWAGLGCDEDFVIELELECVCLRGGSSTKDALLSCAAFSRAARTAGEKLTESAGERGSE